VRGTQGVYSWEGDIENIQEECRKARGIDRSVEGGRKGRREAGQKFYEDVGVEKGKEKVHARLALMRGGGGGR